LLGTVLVGYFSFCRMSSSRRVLIEFSRVSPVSPVNFNESPSREITMCSLRQCVRGGTAELSRLSPVNVNESPSREITMYSLRQCVRGGTTELTRLSPVSRSSPLSGVSPVSRASPLSGVSRLSPMNVNESPSREGSRYSLRSGVHGRTTEFSCISPVNVIESPSREITMYSLRRCVCGGTTEFSLDGASHQWCGRCGVQLLINGVDTVRT